MIIITPYTLWNSDYTLMAVPHSNTRGDILSKHDVVAHGGTSLHGLDVTNYFI
jgi:hypothetical protein